MYVKRYYLYRILYKILSVHVYNSQLRIHHYTLLPADEQKHIIIVNFEDGPFTACDWRRMKVEAAVG